VEVVVEMVRRGAKIVWPFFWRSIGANEVPANEGCCHPLRRALCSFCTLLWCFDRPSPINYLQA
jgi:hypothetical protein